MRISLARPMKTLKKAETAKFSLLSVLGTINVADLALMRLWDDLRWSVAPSHRVRRMMWINRAAGLAAGVALGALAIRLVETRVLGRTNGHSHQEQPSTMLLDAEKKIERFGQKLADRGKQALEESIGSTGQQAGRSSDCGDSSPSYESRRAKAATTSDEPGDLDLRVGDVLAELNIPQAESQIADVPHVSEGMKVVDFEGVDIGRVKSVEDDTFILSRPKGDDLRVPKDVGLRVEGTILYLRTDANQVHRQGWEAMPAD
jgi:hypothetical protein